ncbi:MAG: hypothetical protein MI975_06930 [Cytophagales bacterium]|nr:hypothetical protein [Cytophagales bacterium]
MKAALFPTILAILFVSCDPDYSTYSISENDRQLFDRAMKNSVLANEGYGRCDRYVRAWLEYSDPVSGLIPRNIGESKDFWNAKDAAADNYPFMVLTSFFTDRELFRGKMMDMLNAEKVLTSRIGSLPDTYSFSKKGFSEEEVKMGQIVFGTSEYIKDGLLPLTEWLGNSPWSERMIGMLKDLSHEIDVAEDIEEKGFGRAPQEEVNGELLQVLSRIYWMTGEDKYLDWAIKIGDFYLLGDRHPTRDLDYLRLRDHGCELVSGLCELYVAVNFANQTKKKEYEQPLHEMLDRILEVGRNQDGFFYDGINPQTGEIIHQRIADNWGYTLNGFYSVFLIDNKQEYMDPILKLFSNLNKYRNHNWEGNADGYADAIESALNLYNRIPDSGVANWMDSEVQVMWGMQRESGIIEGWHGDGNFARTTIMYNLWKSKGLYLNPWRRDLFLGAEQKGDSLFVSIRSEQAWKGKLYFDKRRFKENMNLPIDWPRINQFPEWFTARPAEAYQFVDFDQKTTGRFYGRDLIDGVDLELEGEKRLLVF